MAHRPAPQVKYHAIPSRASAQQELAREVARRAQRASQASAHPGLVMRKLIGIAWSSWNGLSVQSQHDAADPLQQLLRFVCSETPTMAWTGATRTILAAEVGLRARNWPPELTRETAQGVIQDVADARARATWARTSHADDEAPAGDPRHWHQRFRAQAPKILSHGGPLSGNGKDAVAALEQLYRDDREGLWTTVPDVDQAAAQAWIRAYSAQLPAPPTIELPSVQHISRVILSTKDTAPGWDGIPYSYWRLIHEQLALLMLRALRQFTTVAAPYELALPPMDQMLLWIPKKDWLQPLTKCAPSRCPQHYPESSWRFCTRWRAPFCPPHCTPHRPW